MYSNFSNSCLNDLQLLFDSASLPRAIHKLQLQMLFLSWEPVAMTLNLSQFLIATLRRILIEYLHSDKMALPPGPLATQNESKFWVQPY